jgi:hypothetical protein
MVTNRDHTAAEEDTLETSRTKPESKDHQDNPDLTTLHTTNTIKSVVVSQDVAAIIRVEVADIDLTEAAITTTGATEVTGVVNEQTAEVMPTPDEEAEATTARIHKIRSSDDQLFASEATC